MKNATLPIRLECGHDSAKAVPSTRMVPPSTTLCWGYTIECSTCSQSQWLDHDWREGHAEFVSLGDKKTWRREEFFDLLWDGCDNNCPRDDESRRRMVLARIRGSVRGAARSFLRDRDVNECSTVPLLEGEHALIPRGFSKDPLVVTYALAVAWVLAECPSWFGREA